MAWSTAQRRELAGVCGVAGLAFSFRSAVSLALLDITRDGDVQVDIAEVGKLNARGQFAYALGKLLGGAVVDAVGGLKSLLAILALLSGSFGGMALARGPGLRLTACFATSRFATAAVWTAAAVSLRSSFCHNGQAQALSIGQVAMRLGASGGSLLGGLLLSRLKTWRKLLAAYAALGAVACAALAARLARSEWEAETEPRVSGASDQSVTSVGTALKTAFKTPRLWLLFGSTTMITPTFDFVALLPQFLHDMYKLDDVSIGSLSGAFPLSAPPAILLAGTLLPALTAHGKAAALLVAQTCSAGGFFLLSRRPARSLLMPALVTIGGGSAPALSCIPPDWIMRWGGPRAGLFAGLHDVPGNLLAMFIYSQVPRLLQRGGWPMVLRHSDGSQSIPGLFESQFGRTKHDLFRQQI
ncbi:unnamed protein product [Effrenium voratum]|uniref:Major facilitator superfamily (MFS) profile domain-containing protein n=1 Tax=Effrenium voratum TaxID=2562239 RepID=A0AA36JE49_9DINO|nr:unnamed protein product [Effrenium voratum]